MKRISFLRNKRTPFKGCQYGLVKMKTIDPTKSLDCSAALEVFRQIPMETSGHEFSKDGILYAKFYLQAHPLNEVFDSRYSMTIKPWTPYIFKLEDGTKDLRVTIEDFLPFPGRLGGFAGSLLVSGKRPARVTLNFHNHLDGKKAWSYLVEDYIPGLINAGYNHIPWGTHYIASIDAERDTGKFHRRKSGSDERVIDKEKVLVIRPDKVLVRTEDVFGVPFVNEKVFRTICDLVR